MKKLLASLAISLLILTGCVGTSVKDFTDTETHVQSYENKDYPQMALPPELDPWFDEVEEAFGYVKKGVIVDNRGDICIFFEDEEGNCTALSIIVSQGGYQMEMTCEEAWEGYRIVCVMEHFCTDNPYLDGEL